MKIYELIKEQGTVGTTGSTTGAPSNVGAVSQTGTPAPGNQPPGTQQQAQKTDPNIQKLAATLKANKIVQNEKEINDFLGAWQAQQTGKTLDSNQQTILAKLGPALLKNKNLDTQLDVQIKGLSQVKPAGTTTPPGVTPPPTGTPE